MKFVLRLIKKHGALGFFREEGIEYNRETGETNLEDPIFLKYLFSQDLKLKGYETTSVIQKQVYLHIVAPIDFTPSTKTYFYDVFGEKWSLSVPKTISSNHALKYFVVFAERG